MTFLRTAHQQGVDAIAMLLDRTRVPNPGVVAGLDCGPAEHPPNQRSPADHSLKFTSARPGIQVLEPVAFHSMPNFDHP